MTSETILQLGWAQIWQVTILTVIVGMLTRTVLKSRPRLCYALWLVVMIKCLTPPLWASPIGFFSWCQLSFRDLSNSSFSQPSQVWLQSTLTGKAIWWLTCIWLAGALCQIGLTLLRWRSVYLAVARNSVVTPTIVSSVFERLCNQLQVGQTRVIVTRAPIGPAVFGIFRRSLVIPLSIVEGKGAESIEPVLAHELLHVRRGDTIAALLQVMVQVIWWFHPATWWAIRESSFHCERCADEDVLHLLQYNPRHYASTLLEVLELKCRLHPIVGSAGMNARQVNERRLQHIMRPPPAKRRSALASTSLVVGLLLMLLPGAAVRISPEFLSPLHGVRRDLPADVKCSSAADKESPTAEGDSDL